MWFKNLQLFRLPVPWTMSLTHLNEQLERGLFPPLRQP